MNQEVICETCVYFDATFDPDDCDNGFCIHKNKQTSFDSWCTAHATTVDANWFDVDFDGDVRSNDVPDKEPNQ